MKDTEPHELSEKQQLLLSTYFDRECSFLARLAAERLIKRSPSARLFIDSLERSGSALRSAATNQTVSVDLWDRVSARIDNEERAAVYLGRRNTVVEDDRGSFITRFISRHAVVSGLSGAAVAAAVLMVVSRPQKPGDIIPVHLGVPSVAHNSSAFHQASLGANPRSFDTRSTMEVDWMRANGSLRLIQNPSGKSAIIWVRKKNASSAATKTTLHPTPTIRVLPEERLDVIPLGSSK